MSGTGATTATSATADTRPEMSATARAVGTPLLDVSGIGIDLVRDTGSLSLVTDVSLQLDAGATLGLVGESGSGKSVTAMSLLGLLPPALRLTSGTVRLDGDELTQLDEHRLRAIRGREVGVVFQDPQRSLNPAFTIGNQMIETLRAHTSLSHRAARERGVELLERVGIGHPAARMNDYPHQLSGGMAQRVGIALAIALDPKLLIADEPTTALDMTVQAQILALLRELQDETDMAMLLISHDLSVIAATADDVAVMYGGEIVEHGDVVSTLTAPAHPYTEALLAAQPDATAPGAPMAQIPGSVPSADAMPPGCRFHPRCAHAVDACRAERPAPRPVTGHPQTTARCLRLGELDLRGVDRRSTSPPPSPAGEEPTERPRPTGPVVLDVDGLRKTYRLRTGRFGRKLGFDAVDEVSMQLHEGETLGLVGESGAGKSTVGRVVLGLTAPSAGTVRFGGVDVGAGRRSDRRSIRRDLQVVFQNPYSSLDPTMRVGESVAEPLDVHHRLDATARDARVIELLEQVGLDPGVRSRRPHELSGGQRQRVAIARALALNPRLIVCDEPVSALDVSTQAQVINLLRDLQDRFGIAYLFVGHDLSLVHQISDRIAVMHRGRIVEIGPSDEVYTSPRHPYTAALLSAVLSIDPRNRRMPGGPDPSAGRSEAVDDTDAGCRYALRCPHATERCLTDTPPPVEVAQDVVVRCHHPLS